jgi:hypothetical protein
MDREAVLTALTGHVHAVAGTAWDADKPSLLCLCGARRRSTLDLERKGPPRCTCGAKLYRKRTYQRCRSCKRSVEVRPFDLGWEVWVT